MVVDVFGLLVELFAVLSSGSNTRGSGPQPTRAMVMIVKRYPACFLCCHMLYSAVVCLVYVVDVQTDCLIARAETQGFVDETGVVFIARA